MIRTDSEAFSNRSSSDGVEEERWREMDSASIHPKKNTGLTGHQQPNSSSAMRLMVPIAIYTSGKRSSAAVLTATVQRDRPWDSIVKKRAT